MSVLLITILLCSGLCSLSSSVPRQFHVVKEKKSWTEAQQYCREEFTDLATIYDMAEMEKVKNMIHDAGVEKAWIGLKNGSSPKWQWSLADRNFYRENEKEFRNWGPDEPNNAGHILCVDQDGGKWYDFDCIVNRPFICYDGGNSTHPYVLVTDERNWANAQRYCREKHTDLTSVRNQAENDRIEEVIGGERGKGAFIELFRDAWEWSDGSSSSFRHWNTGEPNYDGSEDELCTEMMPSGQWNDLSCSYSRNFICYGAPAAVQPQLSQLPQVKRQIVRVEIQTNFQVNMEDPAMQQAFLQQIQQRLREKGMPADAKLTWMKQPDGKIFQEKNNNNKRERDEI